MFEWKEYSTSKYSLTKAEEPIRSRHLVPPHQPPPANAGIAIGSPTARGCRQCTFPPLGGSRSPLRPPTDRLLAAAVAPSSPGAGLAFPRTSRI